MTVATTGYRGHRQRYINIIVYLDLEFFANVGGLCGTWDGYVRDEYTPRGHSSGISLTQDNLYGVFGPSWFVDCESSLFSEAPSSACSIAPSPVVAPLPAPCDEIQGIAEEVCQQACTQYAECIHDVRAACDATVAQVHIDLHNALQDVYEGQLCTAVAPVCMNNCSGNGICVSNGNCQCEVCLLSFHATYKMIAWVHWY